VFVVGIQNGLKQKKMRIKKMKPWMVKLMPEVMGITLCPFGIYMRDEPEIIDIMHENIHWRQQVEMLVIPFYIWYGIEYLVKLPRYKGEAYWNLSFEREAYRNELLTRYLETRKPYAWIKYLKKSNK
jgi:hypothetical protein